MLNDRNMKEPLNVTQTLGFLGSTNFMTDSPLIAAPGGVDRMEQDEEYLVKQIIWRTEYSFREI